MALFVLDCDAISSSLGSIESIKSEVENIKGSVSGYDTSNDDGFAFDGAKSAIAKNIDACKIKVENTIALINNVIEAHTALQGSMSFEASDVEGGGSSSAGSSKKKTGTGNSDKKSTKSTTTTGETTKTSTSTGGGSNTTGGGTTKTSTSTGGGSNTTGGGTTKMSTSIGGGSNTTGGGTTKMPTSNARGSDDNGRSPLGASAIGGANTNNNQSSNDDLFADTGLLAGAVSGIAASGAFATGIADVINGSSNAIKTSIPKNGDGVVTEDTQKDKEKQGAGKTTENKNNKETVEKKDDKKVSENKENKETTEKKDDKQTTENKENKETTEKKDDKQTTENKENKETTEKKDDKKPVEEEKHGQKQDIEKEQDVPKEEYTPKGKVLSSGGSSAKPATSTNTNNSSNQNVNTSQNANINAKQNVGSNQIVDTNINQGNIKNGQHMEAVNKIECVDSKTVLDSSISDVQYTSTGYAMKDDRYVISCDQSLGNVGDSITIVRKDGSKVPCIIGNVTQDVESKNSLNFIVDNTVWKENNSANISDGLFESTSKILAEVEAASTTSTKSTLPAYSPVTGSSKPMDPIITSSYVAAEKSNSPTVVSDDLIANMGMVNHVYTKTSSDASENNDE